MLANNLLSIGEDNLDIAEAFKDYTFCSSCNYASEVACMICRLEFPFDMISPSSSSKEYIGRDVYLSAQIVCNQIPMHDCFMNTRFGTIDKEANIVYWNEVITFPVKYRDLSNDAILVLTIVSEDFWIAGSSIRIYDDNGLIKSGKQKMVVYFNKPGDTNTIRHLNKTPGHLHSFYESMDRNFQFEKKLESFQFSQSNSSVSHANPWLDQLTLSVLGNSLKLRNSSTNNEEMMWGLSEYDNYFRHLNYLIIEFPMHTFPILYEEKTYPTVPSHIPLLHVDDIAAGCVKNDVDTNNKTDDMKSSTNILEFSLNYENHQFDPNSICVIADWDLDQDNLAEAQYRCLAHDTIRGQADPNIKPNLQEKELIDRLVQAAGDRLTNDEKDLLYKFRFALTDNKKALGKLLLSINLSVESEVSQLPQLLALRKSKEPIDISDALKLLGRERAFQNTMVRQYAVDVLQSATDDELFLYLLQLVQALRYEPESESELVQDDNTDEGMITSDMFKSVVNIRYPSSNSQSHNEDTSDTLMSPLAKFLIQRACASCMLANSLYWFLKVETEDKIDGHRFLNIFQSFLLTLRDTPSTCQESDTVYKRILAQDEYITSIIKCQQDAKAVSGSKQQKEIKLKKLLIERGLNKIPSCVTSIPNPVNSRVDLCGLNPETAKMFKSAVYPCVIDFSIPKSQLRLPSHSSNSSLDYNNALSTVHGNSNVVKIMFKSGDDLRQDQLVMQLMQLMDGLLKKVNLNLHLLTYQVLAVTHSDGIMEFVPESYAISTILAEYRTIDSFLKKWNPTDVQYSHALDIFVKSCAASCVATYLLGIGDRHLDNIMMTTKGQLFHIDFGFIFGQDPKPLAPPIRFTREMAEAMGGENSEIFIKFKGYCCQAYNWLRKSANLMLNLLSLMGDAGIQDISMKSDITKVLAKVEEKFRLDLTDEMAEQHFLTLINESLNAFAPRVMEVLHQIAVKRR